MSTQTRTPIGSPRGTDENRGLLPLRMQVHPESSGGSEAQDGLPTLRSFPSGDREAKGGPMTYTVECRMCQEQFLGPTLLDRYEQLIEHLYDMIVEMGEGGGTYD